MSWERRFGRWLLIAYLAAALLITLHIWQESKGEDGANLWSCHTMGHRDCGPDQPWHGLTWRWTPLSDQDPPAQN